MTQSAERARVLADLWRAFADQECRAYSPLYERISHHVADDPALIDMILAAPPHAHQPNVLLAAVHYLLLDGLAHPLADVYAGRNDADPGPLFSDVCRTQRDRLLELMVTRRTQTNECGRSALLAPALDHVAARLDTPLAVVDAGASAGLNLLFDRYRLDYGPYGSLGPADSPVRIDCEIRSPQFPLPHDTPPVARRVGLDRYPVNLHQVADARWLLACVWPDTGRLERTAAAIELARQHPPHVVAGDMVNDLPRVLASINANCVITSWSFAYLSPRQRQQFIEHLAAAARQTPIAWISAEGPGIVEMLNPPPAPAGTTPSVLGIVVFDESGTDATTLGLAHPHGAWLDWHTQPASQVPLDPPSTPTRAPRLYD